MQKDKDPKPPLHNDQVVCAKARCTAIAKVNVIDNRGTWHIDGNSDLKDSNHSRKILLDWWCQSGECEKYTGKNNNGVKKITVCEEPTKKIENSKSSDRESVDHAISKFKCLGPNLQTRNHVEGSSNKAGSVEDQSHGDSFPQCA